jgi:hypothetical protein
MKFYVEEIISWIDRMLREYGHPSLNEGSDYLSQGTDLIDWGDYDSFDFNGRQWAVEHKVLSDKSIQ